MAEEGIEPSRPCGQGILNPQRLPFRHSAVCSRRETPLCVYRSGIIMEILPFCKVLIPKNPVFRPNKRLFAKKAGKFRIIFPSVPFFATKTGFAGLNYKRG
jgi:hypothetical protein